jgi:hypothetical protein
MISDRVPPQHANGPRTFATVLRDAVALPPEVVERLERLDDGRHPTLTEMRASLGLDMDIEAAWRRVLEPGAGLRRRLAEMGDAELASFLDSLYRGLASRRIVRIEIESGGLRAIRDGAPVKLREGEPLALVVMADNRLDRSVEFSAEMHGEGFGGWVEGGRAGSSLLDAGALPAGQYLMSMLVVADGRPLSVDIPIECAPAGRLRIDIRDDATGERCPARIYVRDAEGGAWPHGAAVRRDEHGNAWFHAEGSCDLITSGTAHVRVVRGIEYAPWDASIDVRQDADVTLDARLRRASHMARSGWYSGDVHVHLHYGGEYLLTPEDASLAQRAEDVNFLNMMVANQNSGWVHDRELFEGAAHALSDGAYQLQWGEEYRNNFYGHMCMFGIDELVPPIYSGFRPSEHPHDVPSNAAAARHCHAVGGTLSYAHPLFESGDLDRVFEKVWTVECKELPVDAALGLIDAIDVMSYPGLDLEVARLWYRFLNCAIRLAATAGTDTFMNVADSGEFSNPPAGNRAYARLEGGFSVASWCDAVRAGRTFVTNGPLLSLTVERAGPGETVRAQAGGAVRIAGRAESVVAMRHLEVVVNGEIVATAGASDGGRNAIIEHDVVVEHDGWVALRAVGPEDPLALGGPVFAHTSAIYVDAGVPWVNVDDAAYLADWIERLIAMAMAKGQYPDDATRDAVIAEFLEGQRYYHRVMEDAK